VLNLTGQSFQGLLHCSALGQLPPRRRDRLRVPARALHRQGGIQRAAEAALCCLAPEAQDRLESPLTQEGQRLQAQVSFCAPSKTNMLSLKAFKGQNSSCF
jgi:hypothetical protein